jgi:predicted TPR repeat methyltransferase
MLTCPLCKKELPTPERTCPRCQADLSLLADLKTDVRRLLDRADAHRKAGEIAPAVQAYLAALDVDPTNAEARAAVGPVLLAVRTAARIGPPADGGSVGQLFATLAVAAGAVLVGYLLVHAII